MLTIKLTYCMVKSIYKSLDTTFELVKPEHFLNIFKGLTKQ